MDPKTFDFSLRTHPFMQEIYDVIEDEDTSVISMTALRILRQKTMIPKIMQKNKCAQTADAYRRDGNNYINAELYLEAMEFYNNALLFAPIDSRSMKLVYGNRSYVFYKKFKYAACIKDIEMALAIPCVPEIDAKLKTRMKDARKFLFSEIRAKQQNSAIFEDFVNDFFRVVNPNPDIPCANSTVGVIKDHRGPRVVANNLIDTGKVLAVEEVFSISLPPFSILNSCFYCSKKSLNLIPCEGCCSVLYCDAKCKQLSFDEGHNIECQIKDVIDALSVTSLIPLIIRAVLKIRKQCKNWEEFNNASRTAGRARSKKSTLKEIYDLNEKFSLLCFNDDQLFVHGEMASTCFAIATFLHYLERVENYLPQDEGEKMEAMRGLARMMMFLTIYGVTTNMHQIVTVLATPPDTNVLPHAVNVSYCSFLGKVRHACTPNATVLNVNRKMVLIALRPIEPGEAITINYLGSYLTKKVTMNEFSVFRVYALACNCVLCTNKMQHVNSDMLDDDTLETVRKLNAHGIITRFNKNVMVKGFRVLCTSMSVMKNYPLSEEYNVIKHFFLRALILFSDYLSENIILDHVTGLRIF